MQSSDELLRAFASRRWDEIERLKYRYWAEVDMTPSDRLRLADELRRYTLSVRPDWPDDEERAIDLETHIRVARQLAETADGHCQ
jgi:hypothetical protein